MYFDEEYGKSGGACNHNLYIAGIKSIKNRAEIIIF